MNIERKNLNKPFIAVICGEVEAEKRRLSNEIINSRPRRIFRIYKS